MAAIDTIVKLLKPGDEVISTNDLYGGSYRIFTKIFEGFGIKFHFVSMEDPKNIASYINDNTKLIWIETPTNPLLRIIDIKGIVAIAKKKNIMVAVDNTFATPYLQTPLDLGADIVMHSVTKYLAGHSDVVMGAIVVNDEELAQRLAFIQNSCGAVPGPQDCFLVLRGIKTLHLRMQRHCENGKAIAKFLSSHPKVDTVYYPGLPTHPNHKVAKKQMNDFGGMLSFTLKSDSIKDAVKFLEKVQLFSLAESLGGVESLCGHPASMTHASIPKKEREKSGLKDSLIRLSIGVEDAEDLIADLKQAIG
jgi:cystathionine beta-lyase